MTRDELKTIIGGVAETLKLVASQPEFRDVSQVVVAKSLKSIIDGEADEIVLFDAFNKAIILLDMVYEGLDREVPQRDLFDLLGVD
jgi:hypothetical protein